MKQHEIRIETHPGYDKANVFLVKCSCGWASPPAFGLKAAEKDKAYHAEGGTR